MKQKKKKNLSKVVPQSGKAVMKTKDAAAYLDASESFLEKDRGNLAKIPFCVIGERGVRYRKVDLDQYLEKNLKTSTSQDSAKKTSDGLEYE